MQDLQSQNGANDIKLARADFPTTADDISFSNRMELQAAGYEPFKDASSYAKPFKLQDEEEFLRDQQMRMGQMSGNSSTYTGTSTRVILSYKIK